MMSKYTSFGIEDKMFPQLKGSKDKVERLYNVKLSFDEKHRQVHLAGETFDRKNAQKYCMALCNPSATKLFKLPGPLYQESIGRIESHTNAVIKQLSMPGCYRVSGTHSSLALVHSILDDVQTSEIFDTPSKTCLETGDLETEQKNPEESGAHFTKIKSPKLAITTNDDSSGKLAVNDTNVKSCEMANQYDKASKAGAETPSAAEKETLSTEATLLTNKTKSLCSKTVTKSVPTTPLSQSDDVFTDVISVRDIPLPTSKKRKNSQASKRLSMSLISILNSTDSRMDNCLEAPDAVKRAIVSCLENDEETDVTEIDESVILIDNDEDESQRNLDVSHILISDEEDEDNDTTVIEINDTVIEVEINNNDIDCRNDDDRSIIIVEEMAIRDSSVADNLNISESSEEKSLTSGAKSSNEAEVFSTETKSSAESSVGDNLAATETKLLLAECNSLQAEINSPSAEDRLFPTESQSLPAEINSSPAKAKLLAFKSKSLPSEGKSLPAEVGLPPAEDKLPPGEIKSSPAVAKPLTNDPLSSPSNPTSLLTETELHSSETKSLVTQDKSLTEGKSLPTEAKSITRQGELQSLQPEAESLSDKANPLPAIAKLSTQPDELSVGAIQTTNEITARQNEVPVPQKSEGELSSSSEEDNVRTKTDEVPQNSEVVILSDEDSAKKDQLPQNSEVIILSDGEKSSGTKEAKTKPVYIIPYRRDEKENESGGKKKGRKKSNKRSRSKSSKSEVSNKELPERYRTPYRNKSKKSRFDKDAEGKDSRKRKTQLSTHRTGKYSKMAVEAESRTPEVKERKTDMAEERTTDLTEDTMNVPIRSLIRSPITPYLGRRPTKSSLRYIVIDGSNVAMGHGNGKVFSCKGILICLNYFLKRGHEEITVFLPQWRKCRPHYPHVMTDRHILDKLEREGYLVYTPSRRIGSKLVASYDDRFIIELAERENGVIVSNDNFRDLMMEKYSWRKTIEERLLMYSFVRDHFMLPEDPLGRNGPTLDTFLRTSHVYF